ncbi:MAG: FG-GAP repeat protein, partial [Bacteroidota bacterium]
MDAEGPWVAVGAPRSAGASGGGAVAVYERDPVTDQLQLFALLEPSDSTSGDRFGTSVAFDGDTLVIGAPGTTGTRGGAYVFRWDGVSWSEAQKLTSPMSGVGSDFGGALDVDVGNEWLAIGQSSPPRIEIWVIAASGQWIFCDPADGDGSTVSLDSSWLGTGSGVHGYNAFFLSWPEWTPHVTDSIAADGRSVHYAFGGEVTSVFAPFGASPPNKVSFDPGIEFPEVRAASDGRVAVSGQRASREVVRMFQVSVGGPTPVRFLGEFEPGVEGYGLSAALDGDFLVVGSPSSSFRGANSGRVYQYDLRCTPIQAETVCYQTAPNSSGATARMDAFGSTSIAANDVTLEASLLPTSTFGIFVTSDASGPG